MSKKEKATIFISYSHMDQKWLTRMKRFFKAFEKDIEFWDDTKITPGQIWKVEIEEALEKSKAAILLISTDFFNSDFILNNELPPLLNSAKINGTKIYTIIIKPCLIDLYPEISKFQYVNSPEKPLIKLNEAGQEEVFIKLMNSIKVDLML